MNVGERSIANYYRAVSLVSVVSKVLEKLLNNSIVAHLEKCGLFSDFQYGLLDQLLIFLQLYLIELLGLLTGLGLFVSNRLLRVVLGRKSSQEYPVNVGVPQGSILGPTLFLLYINDLPDDVICDIAINADDTTLHSKCDQASDLWQQLELATELEFDL